MKTRLLKTPDLPSQSLGWASNTPQHLRIAGHWVSSHVGYSACGNQMLRARHALFNLPRWRRSAGAPCGRAQDTTLRKRLVELAVVIEDPAPTSSQVQVMVL